MSRIIRQACVTAAVTITLLMPPAHAGLFDKAKEWLEGDTGKDTASEETTQLTQKELNQGVLEALEVGVKRAVEGLAKKGGYLDDKAVRIPMPQALTTVESLLRRLGQDEYADRFITSMNRAAEQAVGEATPIFISAIKNMSVEDARNIIQGPEDAATRYFERHTRNDIAEAMQPAVAYAIQETRVTAYYQNVVDQVKRYGSGLVDTDKLNLDLEDYVTEEALDGLFLKLAEEEKGIRANPAARTTDLLKKVFGRIGKKQ